MIFVGKPVSTPGSRPGHAFPDHALCRLRVNALGHHVAAAAFAASQALDEVADRGARPYAKAYEVAFGDHRFMLA
jgi:hypothetical protein